MDTLKIVGWLIGSLGGRAVVVGEVGLEPTTL